jgi:putative cell wall-binding protein
VSSMKRGLRRAGIVGLSTLVATSVMTGFAVTAQADWAATGGSIGLVDTLPLVANTQGATLVYPGVSGQAMGDIRLALPNSFQNGDTVDLAVFDRTATNNGIGGGSNGQINADAAHMLGFSGTPVVTVNPTSYVAGTNVGPNSGVAGNTENVPVADVAANKGVQPPAFTTSLVASSRAGGLATDIIRLRINAVQATIGTNPLDKWIVTVSGIKADLGAAVSPGELRVVPLAYNGTSAQTSATATPLFSGNLPGTPPAQPIINTYTVPAYVSPVNFTVGAPNNIVADGFTQSVGPITIGETNNYSLQNGTYTVTVTGATIMNTVATPVTVTGTGLGVGETLTGPAAIGHAPETVSFTLAGAINTSKISVALSGLLLATGTKGPITYSLSGGSINGNAAHSFLVTAGTSLEIPAGFAGVSGVGGVVADSAFAALGGVNQTDIDAPALAVSAAAIPIAGRIGGSDRYDTAAKIASQNGSNNFVVLASGENFPDALSSGYLAHQLAGGSILLSAQGFLPAVSAAEMRLLGTRTVIIVGGTNAISAGVEAQLQATPQYYPGGLQTIGQGKLQVIRLGGADRYATNLLANEYASAYNGSIVGRTAITFGQASKLTALVATGENYADALSAGPATRGAVGQAGIPLILTSSSSLSPAASTQLNDLGIEQAVILGGTAAVSSGVSTSISGMGVAVDRLAGANRYATSTVVADFERAPVVPTSTLSGGLGFTGTTAFLATGLNFADALAGAPLAGGAEAPILLTDPTNLSLETQAWLTAMAPNYNHVIAFGLAAAVSNAALAAANAAIA